MSSLNDVPPQWYDPDDLVGTVESAYAIHEDVTAETIAETLAAHDVDAPQRRIEALVESIVRDRIYGDGDTETDTDRDRTLEEPRPLPTRYVDDDDVAYLEPRAFARVLGAVISRYDGTVEIPTAGEYSVDLFWHRQHESVAFKTVPRPAQRPVDADTVRAVRDGTTSPSQGRAPSTVGVVSNQGFTDDARTLADESGIELFGPGHLRSWFRDAALTKAVLGELLESEERESVDFDELFEELPPMPSPALESDPLTVSPRSEIRITSSLTGTGGGGGRDDRWTKSPGQRGELYADPANDGDDGALDRFVSALQEDDEQ